MISRRVLLGYALGAAVAARSSGVPEGIDLQGCFGKEYGDLLGLLELWNSKDLLLKKADFAADFIAEVGELAPHEPPGWQEAVETLWRGAKAEVRPALRLSTGAEVLLIGLYSENAAAFRQLYPSAKARDHRLRMKLFVILSAAQEEAEGSKSGEIRPSQVFQAMRRAFTGFFPLCPRK